MKEHKSGLALPMLLAGIAYWAIAGVAAPPASMSANVSNSSKDPSLHEQLVPSRALDTETLC